MACIFCDIWGSANKIIFFCNSVENGVKNGILINIPVIYVMIFKYINYVSYLFPATVNM